MSNPPNPNPPDQEAMKEPSGDDQRTLDSADSSLLPPSPSTPSKSEGFDAPGDTVIVPDIQTGPVDDAEGKTVMFDSASIASDQDGGTIMFSLGPSQLPGDSEDGPEPRTIVFSQSGKVSGGGSYLLNPSMGSEDSLRRVWEAAIGTQGNKTKQSLRYESPEASDSILGRVALRMVSDANAPQAATADYQIQDKLGEGGMGFVFSAIQTAVNRKVALKTLKGDRSKDPSARKQFFYEAEITADLDHPNIPPIYEFGSTSEDIFFYTMKLIRGSEWQRVMSQKSQVENLEIFANLTDAIAFAHSKDIIHRDIKPENVILGGYGEVYVTDWGMAVNISKRGPVRFGGTPDYMAPEMANDAERNIGKRSDIYLLGAVLFQIITGHPPHPGKNTIERLLAARANKIRSTSIEDPILDIAMRAMATKPSERYASVEELQTAIREVQRQRANINSSIDLTVRSKEVAQSAIQAKDYDGFTRAVFGFRDAIELWDGNKEAESELRTVRLAFGQCAFERGDFDLALATLDRRVPEELTLVGKAEKAKQTVQSREKRFKVLRNVFVMFLGLGVLGASVAAFVFDSQRRVAIHLKEEAESARLEEEKAKVEAIAARADEEKAKNNAIAAKLEEEKAKNDAIDARAVAVKAKKVAEESEALARARLAQVELGEQLTKLGFASAQVDQFNPLGAVKLLEQIAPKPLSQSLQSKTPSVANWAMNRIALLSNLDLPKLELDGKVTAIDFAKGKNLGIAGMSDGSVRLLRLDQGQLVEKSRKQIGSKIEAAAMSPSGDEALLAIRDANSDATNEYQLVRWDLQGNLEPMRIEATGNRYFQGFGYSPDGSLAIAGIRGGVWGRVRGGEWKVLADKVKGELVDLAWIDNDSALLIASLSGANHLYLLRDLQSDSPKSVLVEQPPGLGEAMTAVLKVGNHVLVGTAKGTLASYELQLGGDGAAKLANGFELPKRHHRAIIQIDSDGVGRIVTGSDEPVAHVWTADREGNIEYETLLTGTPGDSSEENNIEKTVFVDDRQVVNVDSRGVAVSVDIERQKQRRQLIRVTDDGKQPEIYGQPVVGIHPRGTSAEVIAVDGNGTVDLWNVHTGRTQRVKGTQSSEQRFSYYGHTPGAELVDTAVDDESNSIITSAFLPQSSRKYLAHPEHNREYCVWNQSSGEMVRRWSDSGDEPRLSLIGKECLLINSDTRSTIVDFEGHDLPEAAALRPIAASFATSNPSRPNIVALFKRTGGSGIGWIWNRATGKWFDSEENFVEFADSMPVHAAWSQDGERLYVLVASGDVLRYELREDVLSRSSQSQVARLELTVNLLNGLRAYSDCDLAVEAQADGDRLYATVRDTRSKHPETSLTVIDYSRQGTVLGNQSTTKPGLSWLNDLPNFEIKPPSRILAKKRAGKSVFVSMRSGSVYGLNADAQPMLFGRQPLVASTSDAEGRLLMTLHRDGTILKLDLSDIKQAAWSRATYTAPGAGRIDLSPDGSELAVYVAPEKLLKIVSPADGSLLRQYNSVVQFAWNPKLAAAVILMDAEGALMQSNGSDLQPIAKLDLAGDTVKKIAFFNEKWQDDRQPSEAYILVQSQNEDEGKLWFIPEDKAVQALARPFVKSVPRDLKIAVSPKDSIFATGDTTGTIRIWFASPTYETVTQVYDLRSDGDSPIEAVAFSGDGDTLITSDGNNRLYGWMSRD